MTSALRSLLETNKSIAAPAVLGPLNVAVAAAPQPPTHTFKMESQHPRKNWCWAATAKSISHFYNQLSPWTQCSIASMVLSPRNCCNNPIPCDHPAKLSAALTVTSNAKGIPVGSLTYAAIQAQLQSGRVVAARTAWSQGGAHFVVIYDCYQRGGINYFNVDDPIIGKTPVEETVFLTTYNGSGTWTTSYYTQP
jgi:hypothetical protein